MAVDDVTEQFNCVGDDDHESNQDCLFEHCRAAVARQRLVRLGEPLHCHARVLVEDLRRRGRDFVGESGHVDPGRVEVDGPRPEGR